MKIRKFYVKYQDKIELTRAYLVVLCIFMMVYFNLIPTNLDGMLNSQVEVILYTFSECIEEYGDDCQAYELLGLTNPISQYPRKR